MAPKKKAKRRSDGGVSSGAKKRARRSPIVLDGAFGYMVDDVAACTDFAALRAALDELRSPRVWALGLTHAAVASKLPLRLSAAATGDARKTLAAVLGVDGASDGGSDGGSAEAPGPLYVVSERIELRASAGKGRGWFAKAAVPAGTMLLFERPLVATLDAEWRDKPWASCDSADTTALGNELAKAFSPSFRPLLSVLHPPEGAVVPKEPAGDDSDDEEDVEAKEALLDASERAWAAVDGLTESEKERLCAVVRLNSLGFYTNSEQLCHSGHFSALTGSGLYALASGFNHSCEPSVARFSIGDLTAFVTNQPVKAGEELFISYIESELLCAPRSLRGQSLNRDFTCACKKCLGEQGGAEDTAKGNERNYLHVDATVQAELSLLPPADRVQAVEAALRGEMDVGDEEGAEEEGAPSGPAIVLGKDAQELRVVQALAFMQMSRHREALSTWRRLAAFTCRHCPPFDEALVVYATQAALCALAVAAASAGGSAKKAKAEARRYVTSALTAHRCMSGCPHDMYDWRYKSEVELSQVADEVKSDFWKLVSAAAGDVDGSAGGGPPPTPPWDEAVAAWQFLEDEVPEATTSAAPTAP